MALEISREAFEAFCFMLQALGIAFEALNVTVEIQGVIFHARGPPFQACARILPAWNGMIKARGIVILALTMRFRATGMMLEAEGMISHALPMASQAMNTMPRVYYVALAARPGLPWSRTMRDIRGRVIGLSWEETVAKRREKGKPSWLTLAPRDYRVWQSGEQ